jgi:protein phosphatase
MNSHEFDTDENPAPPTGSSQAAREAPPSSVPRIELNAITHPGLVRTNNEDSYLVARAERLYETLQTNLPPGDLPARHVDQVYGLLVADGMGGHAAGEVASRLALRSLVNLVLHEPDWFMRLDSGTAERIQERFAERYAEVDRVLSDEQAAHPELAGMGTTLTLAVVSASDLFLCYVGDSRAYLLRDDRLHRLTRDHSFAQVLADAGDIAQEEVAGHRLRNVLLRYLGGNGKNAGADMAHVALQPGDLILLCSDGLTDMVEDGAMQAILLNAAHPTAACQALLEAALAAGGRDNITVIVAQLLSAAAGS